MTRTPTIWPSVRKEVRALLPTWVGCVVVLGILAVASVQEGPRFTEFIWVVYQLGAVALGAMSIGHEYSHRTLTTLLSQPCGRRELLFSKAAVLAAMLLTLAAAAWAGLASFYSTSNGFGPGAGVGGAATLFLMPVIDGLFIASWLVMLCRSPLFGAILTIAVVLCLSSLAQVLAYAKYGIAPAFSLEGMHFVYWIQSSGTIVLSVIGAVSTWRMFMGLQAVEGHGQDLKLPNWLVSRKTGAALTASSTVAPRRVPEYPLWLLAKKELRLQSMTYVVVGLYLAGWLAVSLLRRFAPVFLGPPLFTFTFLYAGLVPLLIGSLASAEERQFGTIEWQALLPMATWRQWCLKVGVAQGLALVLAVGVPVLLHYLHPSDDDVPREAWSALAFIAIVVTSCSLYVSSLCRSGLRALLISLAVIAVGYALGAPVLELLGGPINRLVYRLFSTHPMALSAAQVSWLNRHMVWLFVAAILAVLVSLLRVGMLNHRTAERGATRIWKQAAWIAVRITLAIIVLAGVDGFARAETTRSILKRPPPVRTPTNPR